MAIDTIQLALNGTVNNQVIAVAINGMAATLSGNQYTASIELPVSSTSVTLVAKYKDGSKHVRRLLVGEGGLPTGGFPA